MTYSERLICEDLAEGRPESSSPEELSIRAFLVPLGASHAKRELRAEVMRKLGVDVDCAADIAEARSWWRAALYDLVLINMEKGQG